MVYSSSLQESNKSEHGEELVGKRVNIWWPLDKKKVFCVRCELSFWIQCGVMNGSNLNIYIFSQVL